MDDFSTMTGSEMLARRKAAEEEIAGILGQFIFKYSRFVTALHCCVAWHNDGKDVHGYRELAEDLASAELLKRIEKQATAKLANNLAVHKKYKDWLRLAHQLRETRNLIMHSRWGIEAYGRHAIAASPIFVEPVREKTFTTEALKQICDQCERLSEELYKLRDAHPL
jgi:hypothetical protein